MEQAIGPAVSHYLSNYRLISSLPILSKVFENVLHEQLSSHLSKHSLFSDWQFGFRNYHATAQTLQALLHEWYRPLGNSFPVFITALSLDIQKAFDSVNHQLLLFNIMRYSLHSSAASLLVSYLTGRAQVMKVNGTTSQTILTLSQVLLNSQYLNHRSSILWPITY